MEWKEAKALIERYAHALGYVIHEERLFNEWDIVLYFIKTNANILDDIRYVSIGATYPEAYEKLLNEVLASNNFNCIEQLKIFVDLIDV